MPVSVRRARPRDAAAIARLGYGLNVNEGDPTEHFTIDAVRRDGFGDKPAFEVLVAEVGGNVIGYALFHEAYETGYAARGLYLCDLYVAPAARGKGAGRALMAALARAAKSRGLIYLWWASRTDNAEANTFYRRLGAKSQTILAHALTFEAFDKLAEEG